MRRLLGVIATCAILGPSSVWAADDVVEEDYGEVRKREGQTLADRIPSVTRRVFEKKNRFELTPQLGLTLNDPFYEQLTLGAHMAFHVLEPLAVTLSGHYHLAFASPPEVVGEGAAQAPALNRPEYSAQLEVQWAPFYGKFSLLAEKVIHFDVFISAGGGVVGGSDSGPAGMGTFAFGQHFYILDWFAIRWEFRDQIFAMDRVVGGGSSGEQIQNLLTLSVGASFWIPPKFERESL